MSFGLSRKRTLDPTGIEITDDAIGPLPDNILEDPESGFIDPRQWFPDPSQRFELEIGSGKGTFLVQQAGLEPTTNFLGIEWAREFFTYAADRVRRNAIENVRMLNTDAGVFLRWRMPSAIISVIHLYFPDPWPKKKHNRRRMVQDDFLRQAHRTLVEGGEIRIVTDHDDYWSWMEAHFDRWCTEGVDGVRFERLQFDRPESAESGELVGTNFERKYRREGRPFNAAVLKRA